MKVIPMRDLKMSIRRCVLTKDRAEVPEDVESSA